MLIYLIFFVSSFTLAEAIDCSAQKVNPLEYTLLANTRPEMAGRSTGLIVNTTRSCPGRCHYQLKSFIQTGTPSILLSKDEPYASPLMPYGYRYQTTRACARDLGWCGATVPIYRSMRLSPTGMITYSYTYDGKFVFPYVIDPFPYCYGWDMKKIAKELEASTPKAAAVQTAVNPSPSPPPPQPLSVEPSPAAQPEPPVETSPTMIQDLNPNCTNDRVPLDQLIPLQEFFNDKPGQMSDHFMTSLENSSAELVGYAYQYTVGKVLKSPESCDCIVRLEQRMDSQPLLARMDHKLSVENEEPNRPMEMYEPTGEIVWCAKNHLDCGATIPLFKQYRLIDGDSIMSTSEKTISFAERYPLTPLCYIWSNDYTAQPPPSEDELLIGNETIASNETTVSSNETSLVSDLALADQMSSNNSTTTSTSMPKEPVVNVSIEKDAMKFVNGKLKPDKEEMDDDVIVKNNRSAQNREKEKDEANKEAENKKVQSGVEKNAVWAEENSDGRTANVKAKSS